MGFWAQLCTCVLILLELGTSQSTVPEHNVLEIYAPGAFNPATPSTQRVDNAYDSIFTTENSCNGPYSREKWCYGKTIHTDFEEDTPNTGKTNYVTIVLTSGETFCGDGYCRNASMLINGTYPGPLIRGNWGDWFEITVINHLSNCNGSSIHWHGIRQRNSVWSDGVSGVTQCPIPPNEQQVYRWRATQYGSSWYHSHFSLQYGDGIAGPLIIDGPTSKNYHEDKGPLMLTDWYHVDIFSIYYQEVEYRPPASFFAGGPSVLLNGQGHWTNVGSNGTVVTSGCNEGDPGCCPACASTYRTDVNPSPDSGVPIFYKYRIINMSVARHFSFWIDAHEFWVVATDFVPIKPIKRNFLNVAIGQRYDIIIEAKNLGKQESPNFWIKIRSCDSYCVGDPCPKGVNCTFVECRQGILSYDRSSTKSPDYNYEKPRAPSTTCTDPTSSDLQPIIEWDLRGQLQPNMKFYDPFEVDRRAGTQNCSKVFDRDCAPPEEGHPIPPPEDPTDPTKPHIWDFGSSKTTGKYPHGHYDSFMIDWANYTLGLAAQGIPATSWNPRFVPVIVDIPDNQWKVFAIASNWTRDENHDMPLEGIITGGAHPIHLHGHDFVILAQASTPFHYGGTYSLDLINPTRRDVAMLPANGFIIIAFKVDNPGTWLMHCHIAFHASAGLALEWVEKPDEIPGLMAEVPEVREEIEEQCRKWRKHEASRCEWKTGFPAYQEDSGI